MQSEPMKAIYLWLMPNQLLLPPYYAHGHFDASAGLNRITTLIGSDDGALPIPQDAKVSRLVSNAPGTYSYKLHSREHGVYAFVIEGVL